MKHLHDLTVEYIAPAILQPNPRNPRIHSKKQVQQLKNSINRFGFVCPVLVDEKKKLIAGHGRVLAAKEIGLDTIPTISVAHLSDTEKRAYMIADNKLTENASWDEHILAEHFQALEGLDFDLELTGFSMAEIDLCISPSHETNVEDDEEPIASGPLVSVAGDVWQLDRHRIICGDSLMREIYQTLLQGASVQMVFTDPPYNVPIDRHVCGNGRIKHREFAMASGEMSDEEFAAFLYDALQHMRDVSDDGSLHYICMDWRHIQDLLGAGNQIYQELKNLCVWVKDNGGLGSLYRSRHELIAVFKHGKQPHRNNVELGQHGRYRTNVWEYAGVNSFSRNQQDEGNLLAMHPTVKPVALVADAVLDCTKRGDVVLDAFLGSGTTLIAAEKTGRCCYGIELDPHYVDVSIRRWQQWTGQQAVHMESGQTFSEIYDQKEPSYDR
ncbi:MAG: ParB N-terminal domain-containing protein [Rickettsiales bacterium]|nr:ParB N-terminal domain-containing protein [Rickettsiales bacterium]